MDSRKKKLTQYVVPTILGNCAYFLFTIIDGIFVGQGVGTDALGAVNLVWPFVMVLNAIIEAEEIRATDEEKDKLAQMNYFADADEMVSTYGEESADRLFQMGAAYYYLIDNAVQDVPAGAGETVEGQTSEPAAP